MKSGTIFKLTFKEIVMSKRELKSYRCCTSNEQGLFEVSYTSDNLFRKLFKMKNKFTYTTSSKEIKYDKYKSTQSGRTYDWFDEDGNRVEDLKVLDTISFIVNDVYRQNQLHFLGEHI